LRLDVLEGAEAVARAKSDWLALATQGGAATAFQSYKVAAACAAAHLRQRETPRILIARREGRPILIIPLVIARWLGVRVVRFLGDPLIQYGDVLAEPGVHDDDIAAGWEAALRVDAAAALLRRVRADGRTAAHLARHAGDVLTQETALVDLQQAGALTARNARELRRLRRRLAEQGELEISFPKGAEARRVLDQALVLKRAWMREHALASAVIGDANWEPVLAEMVASGALRIAALTVGGRLAAAELALCDASCWYGFLGAFDPHFAKAGPGHVLTAACLDKARAEGLTCYDQLPPAQAYKREQATHMLTVRDYALALSPQGRLVTAAAGLVPELKSVFANLPAGVRHSVLTFFGAAAGWANSGPAKSATWQK
jgi:CelD/BcsL family acetyltransferase involved in cellulose biosynthesis